MSKQLSMNERHQLMSIHSVLSSIGLVLALIFILSGCQKVKEKPPAIGSEVSAESISLEFDKIYRQIDPFETKVGDLLFYISNRKIEQQTESLVLGTLGREVTNIEPLDNGGFKMTIRTVDFQYNYESEQLEKIRDENCILQLSTQLTYDCPSDTEEQAMLVKSTPFIQKAVIQEENPLVWVKYYGLETSQATVTPPERIRNNPNCSGLSPCQINLTYIRYDIVAKYQDGTTRRFRVDRSVTPDLRYMGPDGIDYETCLSTSVDVQGRPVFLRDCTFLGDLVKNP